METTPGEAGEETTLAEGGATLERITVTDAASGGAITRARPVGMDGTPVFFGEFHFHTEFSGDGRGRLEEAITRARDVLGLDFAGPADHGRFSGSYKSPEHSVERLAETMATFEKADRFCAIPGIEFSHRWGHCNLHADSYEALSAALQVAATQGNLFGKHAFDYPLEELSELLEPGTTLLIPHHTNTDAYVNSGFNKEDGMPCWCPMRYPVPPVRGALRLIELLQSRGCYETEEIDPDWGVVDGLKGGAVRTALAKGYRFGFVGGTDNHSSWPTRGGGGLPCAMTAVLADTLDTASVFTALHQRRCYATSGARIVADATLNGEPIGSEIAMEPGAPRSIKLRIRGTAPLDRVEIIHHGCTLASLGVTPDCPDLDVEWADERPARSIADCYYYIRIRQTDGHRAWLSPFWIDLAE